MLKRLLIVRDLTGYCALDLSIKDFDEKVIVAAKLGELALESTPPANFAEIQAFVDLPAVFSGVEYDAYRSHVVTEMRRSDPNGLFDDVVSYHLKDYLLIDLVENKVAFPDYEQFESDSDYFPEIEYSFESFFTVYSYFVSNMPYPDGVFQYSLDNKMVYIKQGETTSIYGSHVKRNYLLQSIETGSQPVVMSYCCLCGDYNCGCTDEQLEEYARSDESLPF